jgi:transcriptional regulator with XRE-family HTH domain
MTEDWRTALRAARRKAGMSMEAVAAQSGLSYETVRGYENGRRRPTRDNLLRVLAVMRMPAVDANGLLEGAGFAPEASLYGPDERPGFAFRVNELQTVVEKRPWPAMATDDALRVVAANRTVQALWGFDFVKERRRRTAPQMNMFVIGGDFGFLDRVTNWPVSFRAAAEMNKGRPERLRLPAGTAEMMAAMREISGGDPALMRRLVGIWTKAKPSPARLQSDFPVIWRDPDYGEMRFRSVISVASERELLHFRDWHPVDAKTWQVLEKVKARWARGPVRARSAKA